jgi:trehalose 6-phosphate synthase
VNPYDVDGCAEAYYAALTMPRGRAPVAHAAAARRVRAYDVHAWSAAFLEALEAARPA